MIIKKPLVNFILWCLTFVFICLIGVSDVFALTNNDQITFYNNNGSSVNAVTTSFDSTTKESSASITTITSSYGGLVVYQLSTPLVQNHLYKVFLNVGAESNGGYTTLSSKNKLGVGNTAAAAASSYVNSTITPSFSTNPQVTTDKGRGVYYIFTAPSNAVYLALPYTTQYTCYSCRNYSYGLDIEDAGDTTGLTQDELNEQITNQTTIINNEIDNLETSFTESVDDLIEENKNNLNTCRDSVNLLQNTASTQTINGVTFTINNDGTVLANGTATANAILILNSFAFESGINYTLSGCPSGGSSSTYRLDAYGTSGDASGLSIDSGNGVSINTGNGSRNIRIVIFSGTTVNNLLFKPMIEKGTTASDYEEYGEEICKNKIDETNESINNLDSTLKSDDIDDDNISSAFEDFNDFLDDNSTITQLITLPITLYTAILNNVNGTCSPFNLGSLFGEDLILPCINISQYLGSSLWTMIDIIISGFAVYGISKKMIKIFNNFSSLREGDVIDD